MLFSYPAWTAPELLRMVNLARMAVWLLLVLIIQINVESMAVVRMNEWNRFI